MHEFIMIRSVCGDQNLEGPSGSIQSPGYPIGYPHHSLCIWKITGPLSRSVTLEFQDLDLQLPRFVANGSEGCWGGDHILVSGADDVKRTRGP